MMVVLPGQLSDLVYSDNSISPRALAQLMTHVVILASHADVEVRAPLATDQQGEALDFLRRKLVTDFALGCALAVARARGYSVWPGGSLWAVLHSVLMVKDDDWLRRIFRQLLAGTQGIGRPVRARQIPIGTGRRLSKKSYWNLMSVADEDGWEDADRLRLIEEYLDPAPGARFIHYGDGDEVSGAEWRELYKSLFGGSFLCHGRSSLKLSRSPSAGKGRFRWT